MTQSPDIKISEPNKTCENCEYFDIGAMEKNGHSDCLNSLSPRFQTYKHESCIQWTESST